MTAPADRSTQSPDRVVRNGPRPPGAVLLPVHSTGRGTDCDAAYTSNRRLPRPTSWPAPHAVRHAEVKGISNPRDDRFDRPTGLATCGVGTRVGLW